MSRSYKKFPTVKIGYSYRGSKKAKKVANRKVRRYLKDISNGSSYKKIYPSREIWDYSFTKFKEWEIKEWYDDQYEIMNNINSWKRKYNTTLEEALNNWYKYYKSK